MKLSRGKSNKFFRNYIDKEFLSIILKVLLVTKAFRSQIFVQNLQNRDLFHFLLKNISLVKFNYFCTITGRGRGIFNFFKLSRLTLREYSSRGKVIGLKKAI